jgi:hypothetical protein
MQPPPAPPKASQPVAAQDEPGEPDLDLEDGNGS